MSRRTGTGALARVAALPPRRRAVLAVFLALCVAAGAWSVAAGRADRHPAADQSRPGPVVLVPGFGGSTERLRPLADRLAALGRVVRVVTLPGDATGPLADQAGALDAVVTAAERAGAPSVDVVGYSDGGLVTRWWVHHDGGRWRARRVLTLATPNHGTDLAAAVTGDDAGRLCPAACRDVAPDSRFLATLNARDETPAGPLWISVYSRTDDVVRPPASARLAGAVDVALQDVCPGAVGHSEVPADPLAIGVVARELGTDPPATPVPADCARLRALGGDRVSS